MKTSVRTIAVLLLFSAASVQAATPCRSAAAATQGSQVAYQRDVQVAQDTAQRERSSSDILGRCVSGVTAVITAPQFPSLSEIFDQIKSRICQIASDQVNGAIGDVNNQINGAMGSINGQITNTGAGQVIGNGNVPTIGGPVIQPAAPGAAPSPSFWTNIWR